LIAKAGLAMDGLETFLKSRKFAIDFAAGEICAPWLALRLRTCADRIASNEKSRDD
jgi:hypothetical protein